MARKVKRRKKSAPTEKFLVARIDRNTVLAGWCLPIVDRKLADKIGNLTSRSGVKALPQAFVITGEAAFLMMMGGTLQGTLGPPRQ